MRMIQTDVSGFPEYHKIETPFERNEDFTVDPLKLKRPVLGTIRQWDVTEKIDGMNIRVMLGEDGSIQFGGRTDRAQIPADLIARLVQRFSPDLMSATFWTDEAKPQVVLFGEGYGAGIQKGGGYREDKDFILFDVLVGGQWWLDREAVEDVAAKLGCDSVPYLGRWALDDIVVMVRTPRPSRIGSAVSEGIVARPIETLYDKRGKRIIIKLKTRDFQAGKR